MSLVDGSVAHAERRTLASELLMKLQTLTVDTLLFHGLDSSEQRTYLSRDAAWLIAELLRR